MQEDKIISALIGLVGACGNNPKTENTDRLVIKSLAFSSCRNGDADTVIEEIHAEKNVIAPGCALCATPCGNTSDYDMDRIYNAEDEIRKVKLHILSELREAAAYICFRQNEKPISEAEAEFFYKALAYLSCDMEKEALIALSDEAQEIKRKMKEQ